MSMVRCEAADGPRAGFKIIAITNFDGIQEFLAIEERFLALRDSEYYLPVLLITKNRNRGALVQLPMEADSGARRIWVKPETLVDEPDPDEVYA